MKIVLRFYLSWLSMVYFVRMLKLKKRVLSVAGAMDGMIISRSAALVTLAASAFSSD